MALYKHTQIGYLILIILIILVLFDAWLYRIIFIKSGFHYISTAVTLLVLFIISSFIMLHIAIDENYLRVKFGYGIFRKTFPLKEIVSAKTVKNHWYYGWGIRVWFWPYMWIYNVSGFDAVEIIMKDRRIYRIGTDVPEELEAAINKNIESGSV